MAYIDTPRTTAGDATYMDHGRAIDEETMEMSFVSPKKRGGDLLSQIRGKQAHGLRTPSARPVLLDRPNISKKGTAGEFTPLLKSATKNLARKGKENARAPHTPGFLKTLHEMDEEPGLPMSESSVVVVSDSDNTDMALRHSGVHGLPTANSSSIMATPMLGDGKNGRMLEDQKNLMTLREQENIINKTEKENFGLKLKIHFLEEMLAKSDPNLNQDAIRQNTDLRVDRASLQRDLAKVKKQLQISARDAEALRQQLLDDQAKSDQQATDKRVRRELEILRETVKTKEVEIEKLQYRLETESKTQEVDNLKATIEDLESDLREKDRIIDTHEEDKESDASQSRLVRELQRELDEANEKIEESADLQARNDELEEAIRQAKQDVADAEEGERRAERERDSAIDDSKQELEDAQSNFRTLREKYDILKDGYKTKSQTLHDLEATLADTKSTAEQRERDLLREHESLRRRQEELLSSRPSEDRMQDLLRQLHNKADEKDLLQNRHDALTKESEALQRDIGRVRSKNVQLQQDISLERQRSLDSERLLKEEARKTQEKLSSENSRLRTSLEADRNRADSVEDRWHAKCKDLEGQKEAVERRAAGLQQTIDKLQQSEGNLSTRESRLQASLEAEKQRNVTEEKSLQRQLLGLQADLDEKRDTIDRQKSEVSALKEDLRLRTRDLDAAVQKHEALEDEIVVLQSSMEEDGERIQRENVRLLAEVDKQKQQILTSKADISRLNAELQTAESKIQSLRQDVLTRSSRKHQVDSRVDEMTQLIADLQSDNKVLKIQLKDAQNKAAELEVQAQSKHKDLSFFRHDHDDKNERITELETDKRKLSRQLQAAQDDAKDLAAQVETHRRSAYLLENREDANKVRELQSEKRALSIKLTEALERVKISEAKADAVQSDVDSLRQEREEQRAKESGSLSRERLYKDEISKLEEKVVELRNQLRSSKSNETPIRLPAIGPVATPHEIADLRRQLDDTRKQCKDYRTQVEDLEKKARKATTGYDKACYEREDEVWQLRRDLEKKSLDLELGKAELDRIRDAVDKSTTKLRMRIQELEKEVRQARLTHAEDDTIAMERRDLHDMVKSAKLEAEDLRAQLNTHQSEVNAAAEREKAVRSTMQRIRDERAEQQQRAVALTNDLAKLQDRYDAKVEELYQRNNQPREPQPKDKKTTAEMKGLAKQIGWLKQNLDREKNFRQALTFEKQYYLQQIDMYNACNVVDIGLLKQMGCYTKAPKKIKTRSLRPVANAIIAMIRMRNFSADWVAEQKHHADVTKKIEQARGKRRVSGARR